MIPDTGEQIRFGQARRCLRCVRIIPGALDSLTGWLQPDSIERSCKKDIRAQIEYSIVLSHIE